MNEPLTPGAPSAATAPPAAAPTAAPPTPHYPSSTTPPVSATPPAGSSAAAPAAPAKFEYTEDRSKWVPDHRAAEMARARQTAEAEAAVLRRQMAAITGVTPPDPAAAERAELSKALGGIHPNLDKLLNLSEQDLDQLLQFVPNIGAVTATIDQYWNTSVDTTLDAVGTKFKAAGVNVDFANNPEDADIIRGALVRYIRADNTGRREDRFERGDQTVLDEFVTHFRSRFGGSPAPAAPGLDAAREAERIRRLPTSGARAAGLPSTETPAPLKPTGSTADRRALHTRARTAYLERVGARS